jgi:hypothetical protein
VDFARFDGVRDQLWLRFTWQEPDSLRYDAEPAAIEEGIKAVAKFQQAFKHRSIFSDCSSAIARVKHNKFETGNRSCLTIPSTAHGTFLGRWSNYRLLSVALELGG